MSTEQALLLATVGVFTALVVAYQLLRIWQDRHAKADALEDDGWVYDGPDSLRLLEDTERYIDRLADRDRELKAGFDRLAAAIHQQRKDEQS